MHSTLPQRSTYRPQRSTYRNGYVDFADFIEPHGEIISDRVFSAHTRHDSGVTFYSLVTGRLHSHSHLQV